MAGRRPCCADMLDSLEKFEISSETFLTVFLPVLLFETALSMNVAPPDG